MKIPTTSRNDPCPCGSGRKFKKCCLTREESATTDHGATGAPAELRQALESMRFTSLAEVQTFVERHAQQRNQKLLDEFHGLSPEQIHHMLYFPFASPELIRFPKTLGTAPAAPILTLFSLLVEAIGAQGLKPTAKGNLPQKLCREAALAYWGETTHRGNIRFGNINKEEDFSDLNTTRLVAELAGLIRKHKGRFILSRDCRTLLTSGKGLAAIYPRLLRTYIEQFNWGYLDRYPELRFIQTAFLFTLYLLTLYGDTWRPHEFYADSFLCAFPMVLNEVPPDPVFTPEEEIHTCYTWRTLKHFADFLGLASMEPVSEERFCRQYRVRATPLLHKAVQFQLSGLSK